MKVIFSLISILLLNTLALAQQSECIVPAKVNDTVLFTTASALPKHSKAADYLQVFVGNKSTFYNAKKPIAGKYTVHGNTISFLPQFNFVAEQNYLIKIKENREEYRFIPFKIEDKKTSNPQVTAIYPSGDILPENVLRFYIHFSQPMQPYVAFKHIKLIDEQGKIDSATFMKFKQELWSADHKRLTVLIDPGRIKRGLPSNDRIGAALHEGKKYKIVIDSEWKTANGNKNLLIFEKEFSVTTALRTLPNTNDWEISTPKLNSKDTLKITFHRPFDYELLQQYIHVFSDDNSEIKGKIIVKKNETEWLFSPNEEWKTKEIRLVINGNLEDVAGNNFKDLMDHRLQDGTKGVSFVEIPIKLKL